MTAIDKSPEQLSAEAAVPLTARIAAHRLMYRKDAGLPLRLHQRDGEDAGLGAPFNTMFAAYLDGQVGHSDSWNAALLWMRERVCRVTHTTHWEPVEWGGSLCYRLSSHVIRWEWELPDVMAYLGLTDEGKTERTLESALIAVEHRLEWLRGDPPEVRREPKEWMAVAVTHKPLDGLHAAECPQCRRGAA